MPFCVVTITKVIKMPTAELVNNVVIKIKETKFSFSSPKGQPQQTNCITALILTRRNTVHFRCQLACTMVTSRQGTKSFHFIETEY